MRVSKPPVSDTDDGQGSDQKLQQALDLFVDVQRQLLGVLKGRPGAVGDLASSLGGKPGGGGAGANPLMDLLGGEAGGLIGGLTELAGPVGTLVDVTIAAAGAVKKMADEAAEAARRFSELHFQTGGTNAETARLQIYSHAFGTDFGQMAGNLNQRLTSDPMAMAYGAQFGAVQQRGPFQNVDQATNLLKVVDGLRQITNEQERIRVARQLGVEGALPLTQISGGQLDRLQGDANTTSRIMDPEFQKQSAEFNAAKSRLDTGMQNMETAFAKSFFPVIIPIMNMLADGMEGIAALMDGHPLDALKHFTNGFISSEQALVNGFAAVNLPGKVMGMGLDKLSPGFSKGMTVRGFGGGDDSDGHTNAMNANTVATDSLRLAIASLDKKIGGGERARDAMPASLGGVPLSRAIEQNALRQGNLS